jgi:hypothetical protein
MAILGSKLKLLFYFLLLLLTVKSVQAINVSTCTELQNIQGNLAATYDLINDIDCADTVNWNASTGFMPIGSGGSPFTGTVNGHGFTISQINIDRNSGDQAIFAYATGANINNLTLDSCIVDTTDAINAAILIAQADNVNLNNSTH